jgi:hypothetical protein
MSRVGRAVRVSVREKARLCTHAEALRRVTQARKARMVMKLWSLGNYDESCSLFELSQARPICFRANLVGMQKASDSVFLYSSGCHCPQISLSPHHHMF